MPRVTYVKSARKDVPNSDIKKGESYYWWKFRVGGKRVSRTRPRPQDLTQSDFLITVYDLSDRWAGIDIDSLDEVAEIKSELETLRDEYEEKIDNVPDSLKEAPVAQLMEERKEQLEELIGEIENLESQVEEFQGEEFDSEEETENAFENLLGELNGVSWPF